MVHTAAGDVKQHCSCIPARQLGSPTETRGPHLIKGPTLTMKGSLQSWKPHLSSSSAAGTSTAAVQAAQAATHSSGCATRSRRHTAAAAATYTGASQRRSAADRPRVSFHR